MSQSIRSKKGFTLVELVVVIAILAILAAIAIPAVMNVIDKANTSSDLANAKTMESALKTGVALNNPSTDSTEVKLIPGTDGTVTAAQAKTYLESPGVDIKVENPKRNGYRFYMNTKTLKVNCESAAPTGGGTWEVLEPAGTAAD